VLAICEVKARAGLAFGHPGEAVTPEKARRVRHAAARFRESLSDLDPSLARSVREVRFDVALVVGTELELLTDAI
jgi:Holliday junction resolvase-like predicted endonuclease